jgi:hypothetical protein
MGLVVKQNNVYAHMWGSFAISNGNQNGVELGDLAAKDMLPADITVAQKLIRECICMKYKGC